MFDLVLCGSGFGCSPLNDSHQLMNFECGRGSGLADWLSFSAMTFQQENLCQVWVLHKLNDPEEVAGYFSMSSHSINAVDVAGRDKPVHRMNSNMLGQFSSFPAQLLGKFALDEAHQGGDLGALLMGCVYAVDLEVTRVSASKFLVLDAQESGLVRYYEERYRFVASTAPSQPTRMYRATAGIAEDFRVITGG